jgi:hypothetical protein
MWLNERNIEIRCVRLKPYKYKNEIFIDVQQIIPLPEAEDYQVLIKQKIEERRGAKKSTKDYTSYLFNGNTYNKRKLVLNVIQHWVELNKPKDFNALIEAFPQELLTGGIFVTADEARLIYERQSISRHFLNDDEIIKFLDGTQYAISNQWSKASIDKFIYNAKKLGFEIIESDY